MKTIDSRVFGIFTFAVLLAATCSLQVPAECGEDGWELPAIKARAFSILLLSPEGEPVVSKNAEEQRIPASILKLGTGLAALEILGSNFRFRTDFLLDEEGILTVIGLGDPLLISEEWSLIADALTDVIGQSISGIRLDDSFYVPELIIPGTGKGLNPYDAGISSLSTNFNTCLVKVKNGIVESAEPQTPLTALPTKLALESNRTGVFRFSLRSREDISRYSGEILRVFLERNGVEVGKTLLLEKYRTNAGDKIYTHYSSRQLNEVVALMLEFSNNLVANQLMLALGEKKAGPPVNLENSRYALSRFLEQKVGIKGFKLKEGSGISRENRFTAVQICNVLEAFEPYRDLLKPLKRYESDSEINVQLKTGTLNGIETAAGYINPGGTCGLFKFVVMLEGVETGQRDTVVDNLVALVHRN